MFTIQLFIEDNDGSDVRVDLFKDESVTITQTIQNVRDIGSIFTDFTRTFNIPASPNTNKLFKHYYNSDIVGSDNTLISAFDARNRKNSRIELNHTPFKKGQIRLDGVFLKDNKPNSYKITFFGNTVKLSTLMGDDTLSALDLSAFNTVYTAGQIKSKLQNPITDFIVPIITHTRRLVYNSGSTTYSGIVDNIAKTAGDNKALSLKELKYALRVHKIIEAIQTKYDLTFSDDFLNTTNTPYYNLYMWLHRKSGDVGTDSQVVEPFSQAVNTFQTGTFSAGASYDSQVVSNGSKLTVSGNDNINFELNVVPNNNSITYTISAFLNGDLEYSKTGTGTQTLEMVGLFTPSPVGPGDYTFTISTTSTTSLVVTGTATVTVIGHGGGSVLPETSYNITFSSLTVTQSQPFNISSEIPKIKCIDFLSGIFKMFNLTAFVEDDGTIKIQTLDTFYASGVTKNITDFVDIDQSEINTALPFKEIDFRYLGRKTFFADTHEKIFSLEWGTETFNLSDVTLDGSIYKIELPFEHHKFQRLLDLNDQTGATVTDIQFGWSVNIDQNAFIDKPLLFYPIRITSGTAIQTKDFDGVSSGAISNYIIPSNVTTLTAAGQSIHFGTEFNEYTNPPETVTKNLFSEYYTNYISDVFDSKNRLTRVTAYLPAKILLNLSLADRFEINQKSYKINSISTDMENGKSEIELINNFNA
jgi:hypothetical protein|tara:strand:- start:3706 stop:5802 length:2097 start_codon:yes stop_codon:yes gene_type:complete